MACDRGRAIVASGLVVLEGELEWQYQREMAETAVRRVLGVKAVENRVHVSNAKPTPKDFQQRIEEAVQRSAALAARGIAVQGDDGEVVLTGKVRTLAEREEACCTVWASPGVKRVDNRLSIES
jgi:osmotically-inducible protein OsmY